jgi:hypothetical protein
MPTSAPAEVALLESFLDRADRTIGHDRGLVVGVGLRLGQLVPPDSGPSAWSSARFDIAEVLQHATKRPECAPSSEVTPGLFIGP